MTTKYVMSGDVVDHVAASSISSGQIVLFGARVGVAVAAIASGAKGVLRMQGIFKLNKLSTDVVTAGQLLYWDNGNSRLTTTVGANTLAGYATEAASGSTTDVYINLNA